MLKQTMLKQTILKQTMLKKLCLGLIALVITLATFWSPPAYAADAAAGGKVFNANCAACHSGGRNAVNPTKTLKKADLEKYDMYSEAAIITQVTNGKAAMPAYKAKLSTDQIADVAAYVLSKAEAWGK
jgi:cytochrome c6